jgi:hypothetical protein
MSEWQGVCGAILPTQTAQLSSGMRTSLVASATIYTSGKRSRFTSAADYLQYKKSQVLAGAQPPVGRPLQSAAVAALVCSGP